MTYKYYYGFVKTLIGTAVKQNPLFMRNIQSHASLHGGFAYAFAAACENLLLNCELL